jgi:predicted ester cyclase
VVTYSAGRRATVSRDVFRGTHRDDFLGIIATGVQITVEAIHIYSFSEGRFAEHWVRGRIRE